MSIIETIQIKIKYVLQNCNLLNTYRINTSPRENNPHVQMFENQKYGGLAVENYKTLTQLEIQNE
jgi:hypothetical protein